LGLQNKLKCHGSATVGERGQIVLPAELRKEFGIKPGDKLIVLAGQQGNLQSTVLMKSEAVAKMLEHFTEMGKMIYEGKRELESVQKEVQEGIQEFCESGTGKPKKAGQGKKGKAGKRN
jgi:AbrB family looped-hinge helix DNA binding protein